MEKITFQVPDSNESVEFYVLEQTMLNGVNYILVTEEEDGDCDAYIMKEKATSESQEVSYEMVEEDEELEYMSKIFASILDDVDITL